ncbi:MAG: fumarylacetoacetate hydrolase family protein [Candidatus Lokiarchaeota archaeon]|nr:fumarylacetoacetate hydrolase family protein [Candidatus Lokiarchaeota archaeon]
MITLPIKGQGGTYELHPVKIVCLGKNYAAHAKEFDSQIPSEPMFFCKTPTCLISDGQKIRMPKKEELGIERVDHEVELAVIIGKDCKDVAKAEAMEHVFGYTVFNDVTARDLQKRDIAKMWPWFRSKNLDTFGPVGPRVVLAGELDPRDLPLELKVNGVVKQRSNTREMIFPVPTLISFISKYMTLEEGDIIATGTPDGVGPIQAGDVVEATIEPIGTLRNLVE